MRGWKFARETSPPSRRMRWRTRRTTRSGWGPVSRAPSNGPAATRSSGRRWRRARWVVHGAVMGQDLRTNADLVRRTTRSCLELADELGCRSLALPAFGTGVGGFALGECARVMIAEARSFAPRSLELAIFAVFGR